jgi:mono/diheme cytochrome c family protein
MEVTVMRSGKLRLVGIALAAAAFGAAGCDRSPDGDDQGRTDAGTQAEPGATPPAPDVGVSGGTAAGADTAGTPGSTATPPPVNARPDSAAAPKVDTSPSRPRPSAQASRRDTATPAPQPSTTARGDTARASGGTPGKTVTQVEYTGWKQYEVNCARCHGEYGLGSTIAPSLYHSFQSGAVDSAEYQRVVHGSRVAKGMPNWKGALSEEYLHAIYKYLSGRGAGRIAAGRPTPEG